MLDAAEQRASAGDMRCMGFLRVDVEGALAEPRKTRLKGSIPGLAGGIREPVRGLIFRYGSLWLEEFRQGRSAAKDRPACIVIRVGDDADTGLRVAGGQAARLDPGDVVILPITTRRPSADQTGVELSPDETALCRLDPGVWSWVIVSEFNADIWSNADLSLVPETGAFAYGVARPGFLARIGRAFAEARRARPIVGVKR